MYEQFVGVRNKQLKTSNEKQSSKQKKNKKHKRNKKGRRIPSKRQSLF